MKKEKLGNKNVGQSAEVISHRSGEFARAASTLTLNKESTSPFSRGSLSGICRGCDATTDPRTLRAAKPSGERQRLGFTLIELLVVVLIIGILAAVAVPQYQKVVERSRATQALTLLKTTADAFQAHHMATGEWATSFDELSIDIPWTGRENFVVGFTDARSNGEWSVGIENVNGYVIVMAGRIAGNYKGAYFAIVFVTPDGFVENPTMRCYERIDSGALFQFDPSLPAGAFCEKIMKGTFLSQSQWARNYNLP